MAVTRKRFRRGPFLETLEGRMLLAGDGFHNFLQPHDVNDDSRVSAADALFVINRLSGDDSRGSASYEDVNDDGRVTAQDALHVINGLSHDRSNSNANDEAIARLYREDGVRVKVEFEIEDSGLKVEVKVQNAAPNETFEVRVDDVRLGEITTDGRGRGKLELGAGQDLPLPSVMPQIRSGMTTELVRASDSSSSTSSSSTSSSSSDSSSSGNSSSSSSSSSDSSSSSTGASTSDTRELKARLIGDASIDAESKFESSPTGVEFSAELRNAPANTTFDVQVDGEIVGALTTDSRGRGRLQFEQNDDSKPFPANFPNVDVGTQVRIGDTLSGVFRLDGASSSTGGGSSSSDDSSDSSSGDDTGSNGGVTAGAVLELKSQLRGMSGVDAEAKYESTMSSVEFKVELEDAPANAEYSVTVDGVTVGTLRTDSRGRGRLQFELNDDSKPFPANFPAVAAGTEIRVGNQLAGTFGFGSNDD
ncbi:dockerin type I domain-containing protein [Stieleria varia]|uniref:Dockerin type I repeat protein n=1 Tax=Stieleria varia TaxID=2528005 RepID=A0A5C6A5A2_9BACT|nr:dockerin type I domain-containing protein [Stieleria varia]TWT94550.1 Dockerin type I repeat protein [Stieleria varia]